MVGLWIFIFAGVLGLLAGSFLNVCILRLPRGGSLVRPRSQCVHCGHVVRWFDNVPVVSFVVLRRRCRDCGGRIAWQYPLVEAAMGAWCVWCALLPVRLLPVPGLDADVVMGSFAHAAGLCVLGFLLLGLGVMDWRTGLLVNEFTIGGLCVGLFFAGVESFFVPSVRVKTFFTPEEVFIFRRVGAAAAAGLGLWAVGAVYKLFRKRDGLGGGDPKMLAMIGSFLGWKLTALTFWLAVMLTMGTVLELVVRRRAGAQTKIHFGAYLAAGGLVAATAGPAVVEWYAGLFR